MRERATAQTLALLVGATFLAVGVLGFVPGVTRHSELLGVFSVSTLHNLIHLAFGAVGIALARTPDTARTFLLGGGVVYLALWLVGVIGVGGWIPVNTADNWLHLLVGIGMVALGSVAVRAPAAPAAA